MLYLFNRCNLSILDIKYFSLSLKFDLNLNSISIINYSLFVTNFWITEIDKIQK